MKDTTAFRNIIVQRTDGTQVKADLLRYMRTGDLDANPFVSGGDRIYFPPKDRIVSVFGAVGIEGRIDFVDGERLFELIDACQGFRASAFLDSVVVVRFRSEPTFFDALAGRASAPVGLEGAFAPGALLDAATPRLYYLWR